MKKPIITLLFLLLFVLGLAGCKPPGYTNDHKKEIRKEHAEEAEEWFKTNLPKAKVLSTEAYANGIDLFAVIRGTYKYEGAKYCFYYDYYNGRMFLEYEYIAAVEKAKEKLEAYFGDEAVLVELGAAKYQFTTRCENNLVDKPNAADPGDIIITNPLEVLPAGADPDEYADIMLTQGFEGDSSYVQVYRETIPEYDPGFFEKFCGITSLYYIRPAAFEFDDIYQAWYMPDRATYYHLKITSLKDGIYGGYYYEIKDVYDESGALKSHSDDSDDYDPSKFYTDNGDGSFTLRIPPGHAQMLIFGPKGKYSKLSYP